MLEEAKYYIEWTAAETEPEIAEGLVSMQRLITLWLKVWKTTCENKMVEPRVGYFRIAGIKKTGTQVPIFFI